MYAVWEVSLMGYTFYWVLPSYLNVCCLRGFVNGIRKRFMWSRWFLRMGNQGRRRDPIRWRAGINKNATAHSLAVHHHGPVAAWTALQRGAHSTPKFHDRIGVGTAMRGPLGVVELQHQPLLRLRAKKQKWKEKTAIRARFVLLARPFLVLYALPIDPIPGFHRFFSIANPLTLFSGLLSSYFVAQKAWKHVRDCHQSLISQWVEFISQFFRVSLKGLSFDSSDCGQDQGHDPFHRIDSVSIPGLEHGSLRRLFSMLWRRVSLLPSLPSKTNAKESFIVVVFIRCFVWGFQPFSSIWLTECPRNSSAR